MNSQKLFNDIYRFLFNSIATIEVGVKVIERDELVLGFSILRITPKNNLVIYGLEKYLKDFRDIKGEHYKDCIISDISQLDKVIMKIISYIGRNPNGTIETNKLYDGTIVSEYLVFRR